MEGMSLFKRVSDGRDVETPYGRPGLLLPLTLFLLLVWWW